MKKMFLMISLISVILLVGCEKNNSNTDFSTEKSDDTEQATQTQQAEEYVIQTEPEDFFYGDYYEGDDMLGYLSITRGIDEQHLTIQTSLYRLGGFTINDIMIQSDENGVTHAEKKLSEEDEFIPEFISNITDVVVNVVIDGDNCTVSFNKEIEPYLTSYSFVKDKTPKMTEQELLKTIEYITQNGVDNIQNKGVFNVVAQGPRYLSIQILADVKRENTKYEAYYNFDKQNQKLLTLDEIIGSNLEQVNQYINTQIEEKKTLWNNQNQFISSDGTVLDVEGNGEWPYREFIGIEKDDIDDSFTIDEINQIVSIDVLPYPDWASRALGDIVVDVPFSEFGNI